MCSPEHVQLLVEMPEVTLSNGRTLQVASVAGTMDSPIVTFEGIEDRNGAEEIRGLTVSAPRDAFPPPEEDEFYVGDLEGCEVRALDGKRIGEVSRVDVLPANAVITIKRDVGGPELLVPFIRDAVPDVEVEQGWITVDVGFVDG